MLCIPIVHSACCMSGQTITLVIGTYLYRDRSCNFNFSNRALDRRVIQDTSRAAGIGILVERTYPEGVTATVTGRVRREARTGSWGQI